MKPIHAPPTFTPNIIFAGRKREQALFLDHLRRPQAVREYRVLAWHGVGGQGKSALSRACLRLAREERDTATAFLNLDVERHRRVDEALLSIRLQLSRAYGHHFGAFDTAFARYFTQSYPGIDIRERHPELFRGENELLEGMISTAADVADAIPGIGLAYKVAMRGRARTREWMERLGKTVLAGLDQLSPDQVLEKLPTYLGADICDLRLDQHDLRPVVIVDTHEALWRGQSVTDSVEGQRADKWLRDLVQDSPGVLFVVLGREALRWGEVDPDWTGIITQRALDVLPDDDADAALRAVPIDDAEVRSRIVAGANGLPLYLTLQIELFAKLREETDSPDPALFGGDHPQILTRFLDHLSDDIRKTLRLASYPQQVDEGLMTDLAQEFLGGIAHLNWRQLTRYSFVTLDDAGTATLHRDLQSALQNREERERPEIFRRMHQWLANRFDAAAQVEYPSQIRAEHEAAFLAALHHRIMAAPGEWMDGFWKSREPFHAAARSAMLIAAYERGLAALQDRPDEDAGRLALRHELAFQIGAQGRHAEAERELRAIWNILRRPDALGEEHPHTLATRANLAHQIGAQGRHAEAEREFRAIWNIQRRPDALGEEHPHTLATRANLAHEIGQQGHHADAEREFRAIWNIQRRPDALGEEHPHTLNTRHNLAHQIGAQGHHAEAEREFRAVWDVQRRPDVLGEEHPDTLITRHNLAHQIGAQGRHAEAERELRVVWDIRRRPDVMGEEHPDTLRCRFHLAKALDAQEKFDEADPLLAGLVDALLRRLSYDHRYVVEARDYIERRKQP